MALLLTGCGGGNGPKSGTVVGNGAEVQVNIDLKAYSTEMVTKSLPLGGGVMVDRLWLGLERVRLQPGTTCDENDAGDVDLAGPYVAELVEIGVLGGPLAFGTEAMSFCKLRFDYHAVKTSESPAGTPPDLDGLALLMEGQRGDGTPFVVRSKRGDQLELEAKEKSPFTLPAGKNPLFLAFEMTSAVAALDLDNLDGDPIVVDDEQNKEALEAFEKAFDEAARLFRDGDDDGELEPDEHKDGEELAD